MDTYLEILERDGSGKGLLEQKRSSRGEQEERFQEMQE